MQTLELPLDGTCKISADVCRLSEVIVGLSLALDLVEGQPEGHALRTCLIGMRMAEALGLPAGDRSALFYALLLKDIGSSSNAAKTCLLFAADDLNVKRDRKAIDWAKTSEGLKFVARHALPAGPSFQRALRTVVLALEGPAVPEGLARMRAAKGAELIGRLGLPEEAAAAVRHLDEHWDGRGHPEGLKGDEISRLGRICGLAQTAEVFFSKGGPIAAVEIVRERRGRWFDPQLADVFLSLAGDGKFWEAVQVGDAAAAIGRLEPEDAIVMANDAALDRVARMFAHVVDAKSPWTYRHSEGVARIAVGMANVLDLPVDAVTRVYRAALLHDIGKLGVSNLILDKPAALTDAEFDELRRHSAATQRILERIPSFRDVAPIAAAHHERLDGRGYHRGLGAADLSQEARLLAVADVCDALSNSRPYRDALTREQMFDFMRRESWSGLCPECIEALRVFQDTVESVSRANEPLSEIDRILAEL